MLHYKPGSSLFREAGPNYYAAITDRFIVYPWEVQRGPDAFPETGFATELNSSVVIVLFDLPTVAGCLLRELNALSRRLPVERCCAMAEKVGRSKRAMSKTKFPIFSASANHFLTFANTARHLLTDQIV